MSLTKGKRNRKDHCKKRFATVSINFTCKLQIGDVEKLKKVFLRYNESFNKSCTLRKRKTYWLCMSRRPMFATLWERQFLSPKPVGPFVSVIPVSSNPFSSFSNPHQSLNELHLFSKACRALRFGIFELFFSAYSRLQNVHESFEEPSMMI